MPEELTGMSLLLKLNGFLEKEYGRSLSYERLEQIHRFNQALRRLPRRDHDWLITMLFGRLNPEWTEDTIRLVEEAVEDEAKLTRLDKLKRWVSWKKAFIVGTCRRTWWRLRSR